ncbi:hypothetical protein D3C76_942550 [compost metagenome]
MQAHCRTGRTEGNGTRASSKKTYPRANGASGHGTADHNHCHLRDHLQQLGEDAGDVEPGKTLSQRFSGLPLRSIECRPDTCDAANVKADAGDEFIEVGTKSTSTLIAHIPGNPVLYLEPRGHDVP